MILIYLNSGEIYKYQLKVRYQPTMNSKTMKKIQKTLQKNSEQLSSAHQRYLPFSEKVQNKKQVSIESSQANASDKTRNLTPPKEIQEVMKKRFEILNKSPQPKRRLANSPKIKIQQKKLDETQEQKLKNNQKIKQLRQILQNIQNKPIPSIKDQLNSKNISTIQNQKKRKKNADVQKRNKSFDFSNYIQQYQQNLKQCKIKESKLKNEKKANLSLTQRSRVKSIHNNENQLQQNLQRFKQSLNDNKRKKYFVQNNSIYNQKETLKMKIQDLKNQNKTNKLNLKKSNHNNFMYQLKNNLIQAKSQDKKSSKIKNQNLSSQRKQEKSKKDSSSRRSSIDNKRNFQKRQKSFDLHDIQQIKDHLFLIEDRVNMIEKNQEQFDQKIQKLSNHSKGKRVKSVDLSEQEIKVNLKQQIQFYCQQKKDQSNLNLKRIQQILDKQKIVKQESLNEIDQVQDKENKENSEMQTQVEEQQIIKQKKNNGLNDFVTRQKPTISYHQQNDPNQIKSLLNSIRSQSHKEMERLYYISTIIENFYDDPMNQVSQHFLQLFQNISVLKDLKPPTLNQIIEKKIFLPQKQFYENKKTIVFDLDETLIHCNDDVTEDCDLRFQIQCDDEEVLDICINIRPHIYEMLEKLYQQYEIILFTASHSSYANKVIDHIDPEKKYFQHRLFRDNCIRNEQGLYIKDLRILNRDLDKTLLVDNAVYSFAYQVSKFIQLDNGIPIISYYYDPNDTQLLELVDYLTYINNFEDLRQINRKLLKLSSYINYQSPNQIFRQLFSNYIK